MDAIGPQGRALTRSRDLGWRRERRHLEVDEVRLGGLESDEVKPWSWWRILHQVLSTPFSTTRLRGSAS
jgi:hypothetical protein